MQDLQAAHLKESKMNGQKNYEKLQLQAECIELCRMHLDECNSIMEKLTDQPIANSPFVGQASSPFAKTRKNALNMNSFRILHSELPDIELENDFQAIGMGQAQIVTLLSNRNRIMT